MEEVTSIANNLFAITRFLGAIIGSIGVTVIFVGCIRGLYLFLKKFLTNNALLADIRIEIGHHLALGLEFLVAKDIIETIVRQTWDELGKLAAIIALRTLLTLFLAHEVKEVREELEEESLIKTLRGKMLGKK